MSSGLVVVDYGGSNLRSVMKALEFLGQAPTVVTDPDQMVGAAAVVLPGVGAAGQIMASLRSHGLDEALQEFIHSGQPFLGVCMGMQVLMDRSEEDGGQDCLGILRGEVEKIPPIEKVPHMGWNTVEQRQNHPIWAGIPDQSYFYFVHSYAVQPADAQVVAGRTEYVLPFASAVARDNIFGTQFHPEKSGKHGLQLYQNFVAWALK
ncbi:MAG: imidazole glycerol phosphate synthase subunit HisH [Chloroflexi bacterium]|nr:imidazole glycerol phosphate synthase subunit HisH [Chloroflexota bacterium]